jgi:arginyl-tRNA synthetase
MGDLAVPVAFELARRLRKAPRVIAQELAGAVGMIDGVARVQAAPNGYLNFYLERAAFLTARLSRARRRGWPDAERVIVEHRPSIRTRLRTWAICGMPRSATRSRVS